MEADVVEIVLKLANLRQFLSGSTKASKSIGGVGTSAEEAGKKSQRGYKGLAKWAGGASAMYAATKLVKSSIGAVEDLGKSTMLLQRTTGMDVETASAWASVAKSRGIATKQLSTGFVKLSKEMEKSRVGTQKSASTVADLNAQYKLVEERGGKKAPAALAKLGAAIGRAQSQGSKASLTLRNLGVSQDAIAKGNTNEVLNQVADQLARMENPAQRVAAAQKLFGKSGLALLPILMKGRKGIQAQLAVVKKYGATLGVKTVGQLKEMLAQQREQKIAWQGAQIQLGKALLPIMLKLSTVITKITRALSSGSKWVKYAAWAIGILVAALTTLKYVMIAVNIVMDANPAGIIIASIIALAAGIVILYKRSATFRRIVQGAWGMLQLVFGWVKSHWKLLVSMLGGPFAVAAYLIYSHLDKIKAVIFGFVDGVKRVIGGLVGWLRGHWKLIAAILGGPFVAAGLVIYSNLGKIKGWIRGFVDAAKRIFGELVEYVKSLPGKIGGVLKKIPGAKQALSVGGHLGAGHLPGVGGMFGGARGGTMPRSGPAVVGEHRPELLSLPAGARVSAMPTLAGAGGGGPVEIVVPLYVDGREIARAVARVTADKLARR